MCDTLRVPTGATLRLEEHWGEKVAARRIELTLSQRMLAELADTTQATVWKVEHGTITPRDSLKIKIARGLRTTVESLFPYPTTEQVA